MSYFPALPIFTWGNKPAASSVNPGTTIRISDVGVGGGIVVTSDGANWLAAGAQMVARSSIVASVTGTLTETTLATVSIPAGLMGVSGGLEIKSAWTVTNSANTKTPRVRFGGIAGTAYLNSSLTTSASYGDARRVRNRGSAASQVGSISAGASTAFGASGVAIATSTVDTTASADVVLTGQLTNTGETIALESFEVWLLP